MVTVQDVCVFGDLLKKARSKLGISRKIVGDRTGVKGATIHNWESGIGFPTLLQLDLVCSAYNLDQEEMKKAYFLSKEARQLEIETKKSPKSKRFEPNEVGLDSRLVDLALNSFNPVAKSSMKASYYRLLSRNR